LGAAWALGAEHVDQYVDARRCAAPLPPLPSAGKKPLFVPCCGDTLG
jgi:hypothetical protein